MRIWIVLVFSLLLFVACKNDTGAAVTQKVATQQVVETVEEAPEVSRELYASLDRLRIRSDSSLNAKTAVTISERDTLIYLNQASVQRLAMKLRGQYHYEPWLKVKHPKSKKVGWVYGGAVKYDSPMLKDSLRKTAPVMKEIYSDDLEWEGTVPTTWSTATISNAENFKIFLLNFKEMVRNDEVNKIADLIRFPVKNLENRQEFKDSYTRVFSESMKAAVRDQRLDRIFRNSGGASIGDGEIWFHQIGEAYKIVAINFKGRDDLKNELMLRLSNTYLPSNQEGQFSLKAFKIKEYLELTMSQKGIGGADRTQSLGKYTYESSQNGAHRFFQETQDSLKRSLLFREKEGLLELQVMGGAEPRLEDILFIVGN